MSVKVTVPNTSSDSVVFGSANTPTAAEVVGIDSGSSNGQLAFKTTASGTSTERMRIDASGNVGIGTSSPASKLHINGDKLFIQDTSIGSTGLSLGRRTNELYIETSGGIALSLGTNNTERMRIDSSGSLLVGTSASGTGQQHFISASNVIGQQVLTVTKSNQVSQIAGNYYMQFNGSNSADGYIQTNGSSVLTIVDASDIRLKEDIIDATYGLSTVQALRPVEFKWKDNQNSTIVKGFIAQEVKEVLPECVSIKDESNNNGFSDMHYLETQTMIPVLVKAVQELKAELDTVKSELATLKGTV